MKYGNVDILQARRSMQEAWAEYLLAPEELRGPTMLNFGFWCVWLREREAM